MEYESKLIPILREGVDVVKMIFFRKLRTYLSDKHPDRDTAFINMLAGAMINDLFGTPNPEERFAAFSQLHQALIDEELHRVATELAEMRIPLTDALRVQFLCDHMEGVESTSILQRAQELGILMMEREVPLPAQFLSLVRKLGAAFDLLVHEV